MGLQTSNLNTTRVIRFLLFPTAPESDASLYGQNNAYTTMFGGPGPQWHGVRPQSDPFATFLQRAAGIDIGSISSETLHQNVHRPSIVNAITLHSSFHLRRSSIRLMRFLNADTPQNDQAHLDNYSNQLTFSCVTAERNIQLVVKVENPLTGHITDVHTELLANPDEHSQTVDLNPVLQEFEAVAPLSSLTTTQVDNSESMQQHSDQKPSPPFKFLIRILLKERPTLGTKKERLMCEETLVHVIRSDTLRVDAIKQMYNANVAHLQNKRRDTKTRAFILGDLYQNSDDGPVYYTAETNQGISTTRVTAPGSDDASTLEDVQNPCAICMSASSSCAAIPCRHLSLCFDCAKALTSQSNAPDKCPMCRAVIDVIVNLDESSHVNTNQDSVSITVSSQ